MIQFLFNGDKVTIEKDGKLLDTTGEALWRLAKHPASARAGVVITEDMIDRGVAVIASPASGIPEKLKRVLVKGVLAAALQIGDSNKEHES